MKVSACCVIESFAVSLVCTVSNPDEVVESLLLACQHCRMLLAVLEAAVLQWFSSGRSDLITPVSYHSMHSFCRLHSIFLTNWQDERDLHPSFSFYCSLILNNWKYEMILQCRMLLWKWFSFYKKNVMLQRMLKFFLISFLLHVSSCMGYMTSFWTK